MSTLEELLRLQDHDSIIIELEQQAQDIPERKEKESARLNELKSSLERALERLTASQMDIDRVELDRAAGKEKILKLRQQQMTLKTNREFRAMNQEIAGMEQELAKLDNLELKACDELDNAAEPIAEAEAALKVEQDNVQGYLDELDERLAEIVVRLEEAQEGRVDLVKGVDNRWRQYYERLLKTRGNAVVALVDGVCDGCHMHLPPAVNVEVKRAQRIVTCDYCGRILS